MASAFPSPTYGRSRLYGAQPTKSSLQQAREQHKGYAARPSWRENVRIESGSDYDCEGEYEECEHAGRIPKRECIQNYYRCIGIDFQ